MTSRNALAGLAAVILGSALATWLLPAVFRDLPLVAPDTASYLAWDPFRPVLYPSFLWGAGALAPGMAMVGPLQFIVFLAAVAALGRAIILELDAPLAGLATAAGIALHPQVAAYAFTALPESLLMSTTMLHLACLVRLQRHQTWEAAAGVGVTLAAALLLKPVALAWFAAVALMPLIMRHSRWRLTGVVVVAAAVPIVLASAGNLVRIGTFAPQLGAGYATLGVTAPLLDDMARLQPVTLRNELVADLAPIREELSRLDNLEAYYFYSSNAYHLAFTRSRIRIESYLHHRRGTPDGLPMYEALNEFGQQVALAGITNAPLLYARHVAAHLYGLWMMPLVRDARHEAAFDESLRRWRQALPLLAADPPMYRAVPTALYVPYKAMLLLTLLLATGAAAAAAVVPLNAPLSIAAYAGVLMHATFLLIAAAQTGLPRYALAAWPMAAVVFCVGGGSLLEEATSRGLAYVAGRRKTNSTSSNPPTQ